MEEKGLVKSEGRAINFSDPVMINTLKQTVAVGLTDPEFVLFVQQCKATGLNPFKKEVWAIKAGGRLQVMTGINGFFTIANSAPEFDGYESGLIDPNGGYVSAAYPKDDYIGAWAKVYRKDRRIPSEAVAMLKEYDKGQGTWKQMRRVMITKCAESVALRKAFPQQLNGLYTQEEMPTEYTAPRGRAEPPEVNITDKNPFTENIPFDAPYLKSADELPVPTEQGDSADTFLGFGKHKDKRWSEVNSNYLEWLVGQGSKYTPRAQEELNRRAFAETADNGSDIPFENDVPFSENA